MKFKAVVTVLAQRQRVRRDDGEEDEEDEMARTAQLHARMYSGTAWLPTCSLRSHKGWRVFDVLFIICLSHHLFADPPTCVCNGVYTLPPRQSVTLKRP